MHIIKEFDCVKHVSIDNEPCDCVLRRTHGLSSACE